MLHRILQAFLVAIVVGLGAAGAAEAQLGAILQKQAQNKEEAPSTLAPLVEQARKDGMTVVILTPGEDATAAAQPDNSMADIGFTLRNETKRLMLSAPEIPRRLEFALQIASPDGSITWLFQSIAIAIGGILLGFIPARLIQHWGREHFRYMYDPAPRDRAEKIAYLLFRASVFTLNTILLFAVAMLVAIVFDTGHLPSRYTTFTIIAYYTIWRAIRVVVLFNLIAPDIPSHRVVNLSDEQANNAYASLGWALGASLFLFGICQWMLALDLDGDAQRLSLIVANIMAAIIFGVHLVRHRRSFAGVVLGRGDPADKPGWRRLLAGNWHILALLYLVAAVAVSTGRVILQLPSAATLIAAPAVAFVGALAAYGVLLVVIDRFYRSRRQTHDRRIKRSIEDAVRQRQLEAAAKAEALAQGAGADEDDEQVLVHPEEAHIAPVSEHAVYRPIFKPLLEQAAGVLVAIGAIGLLLAGWDVRAGESENPLTGFMGTLVVLFMTWFLYRAVVVFVDRRLEDEGAPSGTDPAEIEDEPSGHGATRLATLLPLVRNVLVAAIFAFAVMIVLSGMGVDIAPLFAGAGVIGLAVGFGAQALIRDIFSGGFFLFDDAFRKGEYVELGSIRGTVEKISLRSFQLRHHNGPLHTIPFGEIKQLTNYSRDWVIMKLPLRVTYDTDVDKVRRLVKKLGQELLNHPEVGSHFIQPLKSQGVVEMEDSAMILRVKFMTKPGDQWQTRKVVYAAIQEAFKREGIHFANREVTVRISGRAHDASPQEVDEAAAAAARRVLDDQESAASAGRADDR